MVLYQLEMFRAVRLTGIHSCQSTGRLGLDICRVCRRRLEHNDLVSRALGGLVRRVAHGKHLHLLAADGLIISLILILDIEHLLEHLPPISVKLAVLISAHLYLIFVYGER